jgi:hypothetical protein
MWQWRGSAAEEGARQNHDLYRLPNGNTLLVTSTSRVIKSLGAEPVCGETLITRQWACGRGRNSPIATRSDRDSLVDLQLCRVARRAFGQFSPA